MFKNKKLATYALVGAMAFGLGSQSTARASVGQSFFAKLLAKVGLKIEGSQRNDVLVGFIGDDHIDGNGGDDLIFGLRGDDDLDGGKGHDVVVGGRGDDEIRGRGGDDSLHGGRDDDEIRGGRGNDVLDGGSGLDDLRGGKGDDIVNGGPDADELKGGPGADAFTFDGDAFDGADVSADGRQIIGNEDFIADFTFSEDVYALNAADFEVPGAVSFVAVDANASDASIREGANVIVVLNADNDGDPTTPFLAGTAANQIAQLVSVPGPGFFIYFNSNLQLNRLVYSTDLSVNTADLKIVARETNRLGLDAIDALADYTAAEFLFIGDELQGDDDANELVGFGGPDIIDGARGDDVIEGQGDADTTEGGEGADTFIYGGDPFDGADVSALGRNIVGNEDTVVDYEFGVDVIALRASDFSVPGNLTFASVDANAADASIPEGANVIVVLNSDNDGDPTTPFLAGTAANQIAQLVDVPGPGFFVYFNSNLELNRLVYSTDLSVNTADLKILNRFTDRLGVDAIDALALFTADDFVFLGDDIVGSDDADVLTGFGGEDTIDGAGGDDEIEGQGDTDVLSGGQGADAFVYGGDPFDGADVSAPGRNIVGNEDFILDYEIGVDRISAVAADFDVAPVVKFASVDANAAGASIPMGSNVVVVLNSDNDGDPTTPFLAGTAANQIATLVSKPGPGFFLYFNSNLQLNRWVYSTDLSDAGADLKILNRFTDLLGQDAIDALPTFTAADFELK